jgi:hypothetical protein
MISIACESAGISLPAECVVIENIRIIHKEKAVAIAVIFFMYISLKISGCPPPVFRTKPRAVSHVLIWIS